MQAQATQAATTNELARPCQSATLRIGEPKPLAAHPLAEHLILFLQVIDDRFLFSTEPSSDHRYDEVKRPYLHQTSVGRSCPNVADRRHRQVGKVCGIVGRSSFRIDSDRLH